VLCLKPARCACNQRNDFLDALSSVAEDLGASKAEDRIAAPDNGALPRSIMRGLFLGFLVEIMAIQLKGNLDAAIRCFDHEVDRVVPVALVASGFPMARKRHQPQQSIANMAYARLR